MYLNIKFNIVQIAEDIMSINTIVPKHPLKTTKFFLFLFII